MRIETLQTALDRYGGDLARWPAAERPEAEMLIATDAQAAALVAAQRRLDAALAEAVRPLPVDAAMLGRIVSGVAGAHHDYPVRPTRRLVAWASAAMVAFLVTGYAVGLALPQSQGEDAFAGLLFGNSSTSDTASDSGSVL
jgi:anti-sigma-K factor RskA